MEPHRLRKLVQASERPVPSDGELNIGAACYLGKTIALFHHPKMS